MRNDGGPAFPQTNEQRYSDPVHGVIRPKDIYGDAPSGMSLRDYFAAWALIGILQVSDALDNPSKAAAWAYEQADEMLKARDAVTP